MKTPVLTFLLLFFALTSFAQFSVEASLGAGLPTSGRYRIAGTTSTIGGINTVSNTINRLSFGPGIRGGFTGLYQFPSGFGFGLEAHWFQSTTARVEEFATSDRARFSDFSSTSYRLYPHIYFQMPTLSKIEPFARMGVVLGFNTIDEEVFSDLNLTTINISRTYQGGMSIGYQMKVGAIYQLNERLGIFSEIFLLAMVWSGEERVVNSAFQDGVDLLPTLTSDQINAPILETVTLEVDQPFDPFFPDQILREAFHYTTFGLSVGVRYTFGRETDD